MARWRCCCRRGCGRGNRRRRCRGHNLQDGVRAVRAQLGRENDRQDEDNDQGLDNRQPYGTLTTLWHLINYTL